MSRALDAQALSREIAAFFVSGVPDEDRFDTLALHVFAYQYEYNEPYHRFCVGHGTGPQSITHWRDIPPAPATAFKRFALTCAPEAECLPESGGRVFHSSGTTSSETSRHFMDAASLSLYRTSLTAGYQRFVPVQTADILAMMPPPSEARHSSLSFMLEELGADFFWNPGWIEALALRIREAHEPMTLFGTAFAWVHFFDAVSEHLVLPEGSVILETGGFKGRSREVSRDELYALFSERLGVPPTHCISEYGMSEMASQFYDSALFDAHRNLSRPVRKVAPYWLKSRILDPVTGEDAVHGQSGLLAHYDLANLNSVLALQTEDYGVAADDGDSFILLGRAPGAVLRGCSLLAEDRMNAK